MEITYKDPYEKQVTVALANDCDLEGLKEIIDFLNENARLTQNAERRERYHAPYHLEALTFEGEEYADDHLTDEELLASEENERLGRCLDALTPVQRKRFLRFCDGESYHRIAEDEGVSVSSVKESIDSARKKMKKLL